MSLRAFIRESNLIEGIGGEPGEDEIEAMVTFLHEPLSISSLVYYVRVIQPDAKPRFVSGLDVRVGQHLPPRGGPRIQYALMKIILLAEEGGSPYDVHLAYETLHPFTDGNGRSGRALWLRMMGDAPLGFLHHWYYQSLQASR